LHNGADSHLPKALATDPQSGRDEFREKAQIEQRLQPTDIVLGERAGSRNRAGVIRCGTRVIMA